MKTIFLCLLSCLIFCGAAPALILLRIPGITGDCKIKGYDKGDWIVIDSLGFEVDRVLTDGGKGGTVDVGIGIGELQPITLSKALDRASAKLLGMAIMGSSALSAEIRFLEIGGSDVDPNSIPKVFAIYKLDRCFVKSFSTSADAADGRPTEEVSLLYNKVAFQYYYSADGLTWTDGKGFGWDLIREGPWPDHGIPKTPPKDGYGI